MEIKRKGLWTVVALLLAGLTIFAIVRSSDIPVGELIAGIRENAGPMLIPAAVCMVGFIFFEGEAVRSILYHVGYRVGHRNAFLYGAADVYFSAITPSATGGQPASAFFMMRDGVPGAVTAATLLLNLIMYNAAILSIAFVCLALRPDMFFHFQVGCRILIVAGIIVLLVMAILFFMLLRHQSFVYQIGIRLISFLHRHHMMRHPSKYEEKLDRIMEEYKSCVKLMAGHSRMLVAAYLLNVLQRLSQFGVTLFAYLSLGGSPSRLRELFVTQCFVALGSNCVPIPGSMGVTDYLMLDGYMQLMTREEAYRLQLVSRGFSFYGCVLLSIIVVIIGYLLLRRSAKRNTAV